MSDTSGAAIVASLPAKIRIGPFDYRIVVDSALEAHAKNQFGSCNHTTQTINIQQNIATPFLAAETFLHEVNHAICFSYGAQDDDREERTVEIFAGAYISLHRDNPWLAGWLTAALADS